MGRNEAVDHILSVRRRRVVVRGMVGHQERRRRPSDVRFNRRPRCAKHWAALQMMRLAVHRRSNYVHMKRSAESAKQQLGDDEVTTTNDGGGRKNAWRAPYAVAKTPPFFPPSLPPHPNLIPRTTALCASHDPTPFRPTPLAPSPIHPPESLMPSLPT